VAFHADPRQLHRLSLAEYRRFVEAAVLDESSGTELIDGLLVDMPPKTRAREQAITWLNHAITPRLDPLRHEMRIRSPLSLGSSEPEPDLAVVDRGAPRPYHPATALLVIEIGCDGLARELEHRPALYAAARVPRYWVVDLDDTRALDHREPVNGAYRRVREIGRQESLHIESLASPPLPLAALFAAAAR
jgi:Uma2 family endonuclease